MPKNKTVGKGRGAMSRRQRDPGKEERRATTDGRLLGSYMYSPGKDLGPKRSKERKRSPTPCHWEPVDNLQPSPYIGYKGLIMNQRALDLFPPPVGYWNFIGAMYVSTASGLPIAPWARRAYLDTSDPSKPVIRVPQSAEAESAMVEDFSWDRMNFLYQDNNTPDLSHHFQIFTPGNLGTYGILADDGAAFFASCMSARDYVVRSLYDGTQPQEAPLPATSPPQSFFTKLLIKEGQYHITNETETLGLFVDVSDGWKVKATSDHSLWDTFSFRCFLTTDFYHRSKQL